MCTISGEFTRNPSENAVFLLKAVKLFHLEQAVLFPTITESSTDLTHLIAYFLMRQKPSTDSKILSIGEPTILKVAKFHVK